MEREFKGKEIFTNSKIKIGYVNLKNAKKSLYSSLGFKCGLEVHQQLKTKQKLFCRCPAGIYHEFKDYDAEIVRHMRPTLSELGEYDGTALMEFKTKKIITYRINNKTACTYDIDDTPPFKINQEALKIALKIALLFKTNIVGEVHITRKQYLDGSIPTGFQRTAIVGVEGEFYLGKKKIRIIQLSVEEDSCREVSDIGHHRIYTTDRLGIPLIETVTYPDMITPFEAYQAGQYIRYITRSSDLVNTGIGAAREDVNVSINRGNRVEIKGVAHLKWIPLLTHNEAFRQKSLLMIKDILNNRVKDSTKWKIKSIDITDFIKKHKFSSKTQFVSENSQYKFIALNLSQFGGILSFFTQPGKPFDAELTNRIKVIAGIEKPNLTHSQAINPIFEESFYKDLQKKFKANKDDAQIIIRGSKEDIQTAIETIQERCELAFKEIPNETRKSLKDGTTIFERVLPGPNRMYPDTDSAPIRIDDKTINQLKEDYILPPQKRINQMKRWKIPPDTFNYILKRNLYPLLEKITKELDFSPIFTAKILGHRLKNIEGKNRQKKNFGYSLLFKLFQYIKNHSFHQDIIYPLIPHIYKKNQFNPDSLFKQIAFKKLSKDKILKEIPKLIQKAHKLNVSADSNIRGRWIMGKLRPLAIGNYSLAKLAKRMKGELDD